MKWLYSNWYKSTPFIALYTFLILIIQVLQNDVALFLIWMQFVLYLMHQFEEYILPGGFVAFFNKYVLGSKKASFPLNDKASFWINILIIFIAFPLSAVLAQYIDLSLGIWMAYFSILNALSHVGMFFKHGYNPGLVVSLLLNIPFGIYTIYYCHVNLLLDLNEQLIGFGIGVFIQAAVMCYGFKILKPKVTKAS